MFLYFSFKLKNLPRIFSLPIEDSSVNVFDVLSEYRNFILNYFSINAVIVSEFKYFACWS